MDMLEMIKKDHQEMKKMFEKFEKLKKNLESNQAALQDVFKEIRDELTVHMEGEEKLLYPPLKEQEKTRSTIMEAIEEHHVARLLMREIESVQMGEKWVAKVSVFKENIQHHNDEEEEELFEPARRLLGPEALKEMGQKFRKLRG